MPKPRAPKFSFAVAGRGRGLDATHPLWSEALPLSVRHPPTDAAPAGKISHGDYFEAVQTYILNAGVQHLQEALAPTGALAAPPPALNESRSSLKSTVNSTIRPASGSSPRCHQKPLS